MKRYAMNLTNKMTTKTTLAILFAPLIFLTASYATAQDAPPAAPATADQKNMARIYKEVRHELVMLPYYGVFDQLSYKVDPDGTVTLMGQVVRPTLKDDAGNAVKHIEGVEKVVNNIEVLPLSPNDDRIRRAVYRAIYSNSVLSPYQLRAVPPLHIIVKNGNVTLEGAVANQMDKQVAGIKANGVSGVFSVTNNLIVDQPEKKEDKKK
jgi:hyperosmotically inducible periplasmic protein